MSKNIIFISYNIDNIINKFQKFDQITQKSSCYGVYCQSIPISGGQTKALAKLYKLFLIQFWHKIFEAYYIEAYYFTSGIYIRCTTLLPSFFFRNSRLYCKKLVIYLWFKYCPSLATTFSHLSGSVRILRWKNWSSFEAIHESIQFFTFS